MAVLAFAVFFPYVNMILPFRVHVCEVCPIQIVQNPLFLFFCEFSSFTPRFLFVHYNTKFILFCQRTKDLVLGSFGLFGNAFYTLLILRAFACFVEKDVDGVAASLLAAAAVDCDVTGD